MTFNEHDIELIERYLKGEMNEEEQSQFEGRMNVDERLYYETKLIAYMIHSLNEIGLEKDNERMNLIRKYSSSDTRRYVLSVAAMFIGIIVLAAVVSVPVYRTVIKPLIEKSQVQRPHLRPDSSIGISDSVTIDSTRTDTVGVSVNESEDNKSANTQAARTMANLPEEPSTKVKREVIEPPQQVESNQEPPKEESAQLPESPTTALANTPPVTKKVNRIVSYGTLQGYTFGSVKAVKNGNVITCNFTMKCDDEDAEIQMHSARATDNTGKNYNAADCLLNGKQVRIKEKWKAGEIHDITIQIKNVSADVTALTTVSFSFQSKTQSLDQKSIPVVLKIENF